MAKQESQDSIRIKERKGTWRRFVKLFTKCRLPWLLLLLYIGLEVVFVNVGVDQTDAMAQLFAGDTSAPVLAKVIGLIVANLVLSNLVVFTRAVTSARIDRNMRTALTDKILRLPMRFFKSENPRDTIYRIVQNCVVITSTIMLFLIPIATAGYKAAAIVGRVFTHDWRLSAIMLAFVPLQILIAFLFGRVNFSLSEREADVKATLTRRLAEILTNIPLAKAFAREDREAERSENLVDRLYKVNIKGGWVDQFKDLGQTSVNLIQAAVIALTGIALLKGGDIKTRAWISFFMFSTTFNGAIYELLIYWNNIKVIQGGADKVAEIMDALEEDPAGEAVDTLHGDLALEDVYFGYEPEVPVLQHASCVFPAGSATALLGESGCGKTTLVSLLMRLYDPQSGRITVDGRPITDYALADYRRQFVMVSQNDMIFSGTIRENLCYGSGPLPDERLTDALRKANAYDFVMAMPGGLDAAVEEYGGNLSGGQRQRLSVARAMLSDAPYVILDEPASAMDALATAELMETLKVLCAGRCLIVIAHSPAVLELANRVVVIKDGAAVYQGGVEQAVQENAFVRAFVGGEVAAQ